MGDLWQLGRHRLICGSALDGKTIELLMNGERAEMVFTDPPYRTVSINDPNGAISMSMAQAVIRSLAVNAAKGKQRAQRLFTELVTATERDNKRRHSPNSSAR